MKLSDLLQVQPRITLALVEESTELFASNEGRTGRDAEWYCATLTYCYEVDDVGLGISVECVAKYTDGVAQLKRIDIAKDSRELWASGVDELKYLDYADSHYVSNIGDPRTRNLAKQLFDKTPFQDTETFMLEWI